ncbi:hypothetical protein [Sporolactobacillus sp. THM19-2]|uniref:hypothetical protein n=1 Tax=Sporolactobacillus sp. THM19-2 TaxID=2511171 RepID=UPI0013EB0985|nr:hypothetical protein [Sporolactobacillus sp. THM19-2]
MFDKPGHRKEEDKMSADIRKKENEETRKEKVMTSFKKMTKKYSKTLEKLSKN